MLRFTGTVLCGVVAAGGGVTAVRYAQLYMLQRKREKEAEEAFVKAETEARDARNLDLTRQLFEEKAKRGNPSWMD